MSAAHHPKKHDNELQKQGDNATFAAYIKIIEEAPVLQTPDGVLIVVKLNTFLHHNKISYDDSKCPPEARA
jgi:hypothetical protein